MKNLKISLAMIALVMFVVHASWAQTRKVTVLGFASDSHPEVAETLSNTLRQAVDRAPEMSNTGRDVTYVQMLLAFQCEDPPSDDCLVQIGQGLKSEMLIQGTMSPGSDPVTHILNISLFDVAKKTIVGRVSEEPWPSEASEQEVGTIADAILLRLKGSAGDLRVLSSENGAEVQVDEKPMGYIADGSLLLRGIFLGDHTITLITKDRGNLEAKVQITPERIVEIQMAAPEPQIEPVAVSVPAPVAPPEPEPEEEAPAQAPSQDEPSKTWTIVGASLVGGGLGMAAIGLGFGLYVEVLDRDPVLDDYRKETPPGQGVCSYADSQSTAQANEVSDICGEAKTFEIMQWVFIATGLAAFAGGVVILALDLDAPDSDGDQSARLDIAPTLTLHQAGLAATVTF